METENRENIICPNCEQDFNSEFEYCPHCGQINKKLELKLKYLFHDFISSSFNIDSKIFQTLRLLVFHPGKLTKLFFAGKRTSYIPPVRLYLIISLVYFTLLSFINNDIVKLKNTDNNDISTADTLVAYVPPVDSASKTDTIPDNLVVTMDNMEDAGNFVNVKEDTSDNQNASVWRKVTRDRLKKLQTKEGKEAFTQMYRNYISIGMFVLMPLTALIFFLLFLKGTYYIQHLVFVLHLQSAMYILFIMFNLVELGFKNDWLDVVLLLLFLMLLFTWVKKYYETGWLKAILKSILFLMMYSLLFGVFMGIVGAISAWNL